MKTRIYSDDETMFFPIYASTSSVNILQNAVDRPHGYHMDQIFLVESGNGILNITEKTYYLEEGDLFYISANIEHSYAPVDDAFSTTYISFFGTGFEKIKEYYDLGNYGIYKKKSKGDFKIAVQNLYDKLDAAHETSLLCAMTFSTVITFFEEAFKKQVSYIERVNNYLETNYQNNICLEDILCIYPYSKAKLCRDFKNTYKTTIFEKLLSVRLRHAYLMIENSEYLPLKTIASSCGFNDISYFCKMYKRKYGFSPKNRQQKTAD